MTISIAIGGRSTSSQLLPECSGKRKVFKRLVTVGVNNASSLGATATFLYRHRENSLDSDGNFDALVEEEGKFTGEAPLQGDEKVDYYVELVLQINSLCQGFSSHQQQNDSMSSRTRFRIPIIAIKRDKQSNDHVANSSNIPIRGNIDPLVTFSSDGRYITCLIPPLQDTKSTHSNNVISSTIVILNLRKLNSPRKQHDIPLPSFIDQKPIISTSYQYPNIKIPIPMDPRIVRISSDSEEQKFFVTSLCEASTPSKTSILLAGCQDGSILAINYKRARIAGILFHQKYDSHSNTNSDPKYFHIKSMAHYSPPHTTNAALQQDSQKRNKGRLCTVRGDGSVVLYSSCFSSSVHLPSDESTKLQSTNNSSNSSTLLNRQISTQSSSSIGSIINDFNGGNSPHLKHPTLKNLVMKLEFLCTLKPKKQIPSFFRHSHWINFSTLALAAGGQSDGITAQVWLILTNGDMYKISELKMDENKLIQEKHGSFEPQSQYMHDEELVQCHKKNLSNVTALEFDPFSGSLAISGCTNTSNRNKHISFVCLWDWRSKRLGLTLMSSNNSICSFSKLVFGHRGMSLYHYHVHDNRKGAATSGKKRIVCDMFKMGILSPPNALKGNSDASKTGGWVESASPLFLTTDLVALPIVSKSTLSMDADLDWKEYIIPSSYLNDYGPISIAALGGKNGQSIGLASSRGVCILDLHKINNKEADAEKEKYSSNMLQIISSSPCIQAVHSENDSAIPFDEKLIPKNSDHKFRMILNPDEESSFKVHAMTWWERHDKNPQNGDMKTLHKNEDLLIAVIEYVSDDLNGQLSGKLFLVCWSRKRLGLGENQLLENFESGLENSNISFTGKGIRIPNDLSPNCISILSEPQNDNVDDRAVVIISSTPAYSHEDAAYVLFQIQTSIYTGGGKGNRSRVHGRIASHGFLPCSSDLHSRCPCSCTGVFLAGGSFRFNLHEEDTTATNRNTSEYIATIGVLKTDGSGLESVIIGAVGPLYSGSVLYENCRETIENEETSNRGYTSIQGVAKYWKSDIVRAKKSMLHLTKNDDVFHCPIYEYFVWTIALHDGNIFTWNVPFIMYGDSAISLDTNNHILENLNNGSMESKDDNLWRDLYDQVKLLPKKKSMMICPSLIKPRHVYEHYKSYSRFNKDIPLSLLLGFTSCILGDTSLWMNGVAGTGMNEIAIGTLPFTSNSCILYSGQRSRRLSQHISNRGGNVGVNLLVEMFDLSNCKLSSPSFVPSLLSSILDVASESIASSTNKRNVLLPNSIVVRDHIESLFLHENDENIMSSLKVLILRCSEFLADMKKSSQSSLLRDKDVSLSIAFAASTLRVIVTIARIRLTSLEFASLFLGIGRQIEPYLFDTLFPLTLESNSKQKEKENYISVQDLFESSLKSGCIWIAASTLPIFPSQSDAHSRCLQLIKPCLDLVGHSNIFGEIKFVKHSDEEKLVLQQLYQFGVKLEEADNSLNVKYCNDDSEKEENSSFSSSSDGSIEDYLSQDDDEESSLAKSSVHDSYDEISDQEESSNCTSWEGSNTNDYANGSALSSSDSESGSSKRDGSFVKISHSLDGRTLTSTENGFSKITSFMLPRSWKKTDDDFPVEETAIQNAASSFISSGFDQTQHGDEILDGMNKIELGTKVDPSIQNIVKSMNGKLCIQPNKESEDAVTYTQTTTLSSQSDRAIGQGNVIETRFIKKQTNPRKNKSFTKKNGCISELVCKYIVSVAFSMKESHRFDPKGWKSAALIAHILCKGLCNNSYILSNNANLVKVVEDLLKDTESAKEIFGLSGQTDDLTKSQEDGSNVDEELAVGKWFFAGRIMECKEQIDQNEADELFRLILYFINHQDSCKYKMQMKTSLVIIALISGYVSGSLHEYLGVISWEKFPIGESFTLALTEVLNAL